MSSRKDGEADDVNVFLDGGVDDLLRGLPQSGKNYFHAGIPQPESHHFGAPVVPVQTGFAHKHLDFSSCIHPSSSLNEIVMTSGRAGGLKTVNRSKRIVTKL